MVPVDIQLYAFLVTVLTGIGLGLAFDLSRAVRRVFRLKGPAAQLADAGLWLAGAVLAATGLFLANWGEVRYYVFIGLALGAALYFTLASATVTWATERFLEVLRTAARWTRRRARQAADLGRRTWRGLRRLARAAGRAARVAAAAGRRVARILLWPLRALLWPARLPLRPARAWLRPAHPLRRAARRLLWPARALAAALRRAAGRGRRPPPA
ncbi:MAG: spore cortex biosynthesis protein YabQ [Firmicutes bacterium]|nr:spore cortex biosynthesis protein YabQ [Bacillota bacterium]